MEKDMQDINNSLLTKEAMEMTDLEYIDKAIDFLISTQTGYSELFDKRSPQGNFNLKIDTDRPIAVLCASDIHLGSVYTDYEKLREIWHWLIETDRVYVMVVGDFIDNFDAPVPKLLNVGINSQIVSPDIQRSLYKRYLLALQKRSKIVSMVLGNHEEFSGLDVWFDGQLHFPIAPNRMFLNLTVGEQEYRIALVHKSRFNSIINPIHSSLRELHLNYPDADIVITSHTHVQSVMSYQYPKDGKLLERLLIKTGTLKNDLFGYKYFNPYGVDTDTAMPFLILDPYKRKMRYMPFWDALELVL